MKPKDVTLTIILIKIMELAEEFPNDQDFGRKVRALLNNFEDIK